MKNRYNVTKEFLEREYITNNKTQQELADMLGCSKDNIAYSLKKHRIKKTDNRGTKFVGKKFGSITVIQKLQKKDKWGAVCWLCECDCGEQIEKTTGDLTKHRKRGRKACRYCKSEKYHPIQKHGDILYRHWSKIKKNAELRSLLFEITIEYVWDLFLRQNKKCALTDMDIYFAQTPQAHRKKLWTASLDRIDSTKGYIEGNIQWVHKDVNKMKQSYSQEHFIDLCTKIADFTSE